MNLTYIISQIIPKEKLGFNVNTINLWKLHGHDLCKEFLDDSRVVKDGWIKASGKVYEKKEILKQLGYQYFPSKKVWAKKLA